MAIKYKAGDVILTDSPGLFSALILFFTRRLAEWRGKRVPFSHAAIVVDPLYCVQALSTVVKTPLSERLSAKESKRYLILRPVYLSCAEREAAASVAIRQIGRPYSAWRLFLFLLDDATNTRKFAEWDTDKHSQVCSSLVAFCFKNDYKFDGVPWEACAPEDVWLDYQAHPSRYKVVSER